MMMTFCLLELISEKKGPDVYHECSEKKEFSARIVIATSRNYPIIMSVLLRSCGTFLLNNVFLLAINLSLPKNKIPIVSHAWMAAVQREDIKVDDIHG